VGKITDDFCEAICRFAETRGIDEESGDHSKRRMERVGKGRRAELVFDAGRRGMVKRRRGGAGIERRRKNGS
jgi:hypothetical protein